MMFDKIAYISDEELGNDRISKLIKEARDNLRELCPEGIIENPLDVSHINNKHNERDFSTNELEDGKSMYKIISRLIGHFTQRLILFHMIKVYRGKYVASNGKLADGFKIDITTKPFYSYMADFVDQFGIIASTQDDPYAPLKVSSLENFENHGFSYFFGDSYLLLPFESGELNENNRVCFGYSPIPKELGSSSTPLESSSIDSDLSDIFWNEYKTHFKFLYDNQGFTAKLHLFIQSGTNLVNVIRMKLKNYASIPGITQELVSQLLDESKEEVFRVYGDVGYQGHTYRTIRFQIEDLLMSSDYCREITFYKVLDENGDPVKILFTKDDFRGFNVIIFRRVKSYQFSQADVNDFFITYFDGAGFEYFRLEEFYSEELIEELKSQGIRITEEKLIAITRNYGEGRIVWLEKGTPEMGFNHILKGHLKDFEYLLGISDYREIAELIFETIKNNEIIDIFSGGDPQSQNLVYKYRVSGHNLYVVIDADGYILTAYPSRK